MKRSYLCSYFYCPWSVVSYTGILGNRYNCFLPIISPADVTAGGSTHLLYFAVFLVFNSFFLLFCLWIANDYSVSTNKRSNFKKSDFFVNFETLTVNTNEHFAISTNAEKFFCTSHYYLNEELTLKNYLLFEVSLCLFKTYQTVWIPYVRTRAPGILFF